MYRHPAFVVPMGESHVAFYNADCTLSYIRARYDGETGFAFGAREVTAERLARLAALQRATPRLTYSPAVPDMLVALPFSGFYESTWSRLIDDEESSWADNEAEKQESAEYYPETFQPEPLRLNAGELVELSMRHCDYSAARDAIARDYAETFGDYLADQLSGVLDSFAMPTAFESMSSPTYYNYSTDRIFATVPYASLVELFALSERNGHAALAYTIRKQFTSYDGFSSHYPNDLDSWLAKPLVEWDHNETQTLILASLALAWAVDPFNTNDSVTDGMFDYGDFGTHAHAYFDNAMNWPELESAIESARDDKREAAIEAGLIEPDAETISVRCPNTPDLFA